MTVFSRSMAVSVAGGWVAVTVMVAVLGGVKGELVVATGSPFCTYHSTFLTCDYKGNQETVVLGEVGVRKVYIHNTPDLVVLSDVCISLALFNVANATFSTAATCTQQDQVTLKLVDSVVNLVPSYITHLEMKGSEAETVACHNELRQLTITNSKIGTLEVTQPIRNIHVKFDHSSITTLKSLRVERGKLLFFNVTINTAARNSVYLHDASGSIWNSNFNHAQEQAIVLGGKSTLVMHGVNGRITFAGSQDVLAVAREDSSTLQDSPATIQDGSATPQEDSQATPKDAVKTRPSSPASDTKPPRVTTKKTTTTFPADPPACPPHSSFLLWALPMVVATVEAIVIIVNCTNWFPALRGRRARRGSEDGGGLVTVGKGWGSEGQVRGGAGPGWGAEGQGGNNHAYPSWYYNTQQSNTTTTRQRMSDSAI